MPGNILDVKVKVGDTVKAGTVLCVLEAMKMENEIPAPHDGKVLQVVVAKGADLVALRIREIAAGHRVPLVEAPPLARALHASCELGDEIPARLYAAVAQVLTYVYQLRTARRRGLRAPPPPHIETPPPEPPRR